MVRLKENRRNILLDITRFQFQYGSIKSEQDNRYPVDGFNFNSNMVRLKVSRVDKNTQDILVFQFQYGSIKSGNALELTK